MMKIPQYENVSTFKRAINYGGNPKLSSQSLKRYFHSNIIGRKKKKKKETKDLAGIYQNPNGKVWLQILKK